LSAEAAAVELELEQMGNHGWAFECCGMDRRTGKFFFLSWPPSIFLLIHFFSFLSFSILPFFLFSVSSHLSLVFASFLVSPSISFFLLQNRRHGKEVLWWSTDSVEVVSLVMMLNEGVAGCRDGGDMISGYRHGVMCL
jgi:hypothetical protein